MVPPWENVTPANAIGQYCYLPVANAPMTTGLAYKLKFDCDNLVANWTISDFNAGLVISPIATGGGATNEFQFVYTGSAGGGLRITSNAATSSGDFDNFSIKRVRRFNIQSIINPDERNIFLELLCEETI